MCHCAAGRRKSHVAEVLPPLTLTLKVKPLLHMQAVLSLTLKPLVAEELPRIAATKWTLRLLLLYCDDKTAHRSKTHVAENKSCPSGANRTSLMLEVATVQCRCCC